MKAVLAAMSVVGAAVALMGCDDNLGSSASTTTSVSLDDFPARYAQALCVQNFKCSSSADTVDHTMQQCTDDNAAGLMLLTTLVTEGQPLGRVSYDGAVMATCISALGQVGCDDWKRGLSISANQPAACKVAIAAKVAAGGACQQDIECTTGHCEGAEYGAVPPVDGTCTSLLPAGASCLGELLCVDGLYCNADTLLCTPRKSGGATCLGDEECMNTCNLTTGRCSSYAGCSVGGGAPEPTFPCLALLVVVGLVLGRWCAKRKRRAPGEGRTPP